MGERDGKTIGPARTAEGYEFDPRPDFWRLGSASGATKFDFSRLCGASPMLRLKFKSALLASIAVRRTSATRRDFEEIVTLLRVASDIMGDHLNQIDLSDVEGFVSRLPPESRYRASFLKDALVHWAQAGGDGLTSDLLDQLSDMEFPRGASGRPVRTCCPLTGSLSTKQHDILLIALWDAFEAGRSNLADHCISLLIILFGFRPCQMARLKVCDLLRTTGRDWRNGAVLKVPRAKQPGHVPRGGGFSDYPLVFAVAELLFRQSRIAMDWAVAHGIDPATAPIFPVFVRAGMALPPRIPGMSGHMDARDVSRHVSRLIKRLDAVPDLAAGSRVTPARLRRTFGSSLADEGVLLPDIAAALDQSGVGTVLSYIQQTAALADRIDRALGSTFAKVARGFSRSEKGSRE